MEDPLKDKVHIIGVLEDGILSIPLKTMRVLQDADLIFGKERHLAFFPNHSAKKIPIKSNQEEIAKTIKENLGQLQMAVLASGDPNFYGIAQFFIEKLGRDRVEILPNVNVMQLAFARIKESWSDAFLGSVHGRPIEAIVESVRKAPKAGLLTDEKHSPAAVAQTLLEKGVENRLAYVCENLGSAEERTTQADLESLTEMRFSPLSVLIVIKSETIFLQAPKPPEIDAEEGRI